MDAAAWMSTGNGVRAVLAAGVQSELDFCRLTRRFGLPEPDRQAIRTDGQGRRRWLDACWEDAGLVAEVDGCWHMEALAWWADMQRDNDLTVSGQRVLRFPAFAVRDNHGWPRAEAVGCGRRRWGAGRFRR